VGSVVCTRARGRIIIIRDCGVGSVDVLVLVAPALIAVSFVRAHAVGIRHEL